MRHFVLFVCVLIWTSVSLQTASAQGAPPQASANQPYAIEYYYKVQWGHQQEFLDLFKKTTFPCWKKS